MAVRTKEELLELVKNRIGEDNSDEALAFIEDITDTFSDLEAKSSTDWKEMYDALNNEWRERYKARFFSGPVDEDVDDVIDDVNDVEDEAKDLSYEALFEEEKEDK